MKMNVEMNGNYPLYPLADAFAYQELDKAHCVVIASGDDSTYETLLIPENARYENVQIRDDIARFNVYCHNGFAFTLIQLGTSVQQPFLLHYPIHLGAPTKFSVRDALHLANVSIEQLMYHYPFDVQSLYDMSANLPVRPEHAAFALARLSILSRVLLTFDTVDIKIREE